MRCDLCGCTASYMWVDPGDETGHACPGGARPDSFSATERVVPGPGERGRDLAEDDRSPISTHERTT